MNMIVFRSYGPKTLDILSHAFLAGCFRSHSALVRPGIEGSVGTGGGGVAVHLCY